MRPIRFTLLLLMALVMAGCVSLSSITSDRTPSDAPLVTQMDGEQLLALMQDEGYQVTLDDDGDIRWELHNDVAWVLVVNQGQTLQFWSFYNAPGIGLREVNDWNRRYYFSKSYIDQDNDVVIEIDLDLKGGISADAIREFLITADLSFEIWLNDLIGANRMQVDIREQIPPQACLC